MGSGHEVFVVTALHTQGGHGPVASVLTVTSNPETAVITAYMAEQMGYRFFSDDYILVERIPMDVRSRYGTQHLGVILMRRRGLRKPDDLLESYTWSDEWFDRTIQESMQDVTKTLGSIPQA